MVIRSINDTNTARNDDADLCLSELTENTLMISNTNEITKFNTNVLTNPKNEGLYSNGLSTMTSKPATESLERIVASEEASSSGPLAPSSALALPQIDIGLLSSFPDSWTGWESKRREESINHHDKYFKKKHSKQLRNLKRIRRKTLETKKVPSSIFRRRRLRLERSALRKVEVLKKNDENSEMVPFQSSKSLRRRQRRRVVRFVDEEITEWRRESNRDKILEVERERKENQRALLDLQVGMKCMGL